MDGEGLLDPALSFLAHACGGLRRVRGFLLFGGAFGVTSSSSEDSGVEAGVLKSLG